MHTKTENRAGKMTQGAGPEFKLQYHKKKKKKPNKQCKGMESRVPQSVQTCHLGNSDALVLCYWAGLGAAWGQEFGI
jgi:hypothetical protein